MLFSHSARAFLHYPLGKHSEMRGLGHFGAVSCLAMSYAEPQERRPDGLGERTCLSAVNRQSFGG
jgi:hypothetical protein